MDEEQPREHTPQEIVDVETIRNLDTARMALRWALERLHKETDARHAFEEKAKAAEKALQKAGEEHAALQRTLSLRSNEADERELYYRRLEEFLSLRLEGKLDPAALAHKELELDQLKRLLDQKLAQTDKELAARRAALEREYKHAREESEQAARDAARAREQALEIKSRALEQEHLAKMGELREKELLLGHEEKALSERQSHFEEYYANQRAELSAQLKSVREEIDAQVRLRVELVERTLGERHTSLEAVWSREKALLVRELETWRDKVLELTPLVGSLELQNAEAREAARQSRLAADAEALVFEQQRLGFAAERLIAEKDRKALADQVEDWREKAERHLHSTHDLAKRLTQSEEQAVQLRAAADREIAAIEERKLDSKRQVESLQLEISNWKKKTQEAMARAFELENKLAAAGDALDQARLQAGAQLERFEAHRLAWDQTQQALAAETEEARRRAAEMLPRLMELERGLASAEQTQASEERRFLRFEEERRGWQEERRLLESELKQWREQANAQALRLLELERAVAVAEETERQVRAAGERQAARFDAQRKAWETGKEEA
jgi:hypothetical protein